MICKANNPNQLPPGGFFHIHETDQTMVRASNFKQLLTRVADKYRAENQPVPADLEQLVVCQICYRSPKWCAQEKSEGLGDSIAKFTRRTGVARMVAMKQGGEHLLGTCKSCGSRKKRLNKAFKY